MAKKKTLPNVKNCVIYARFSSEKQRDESIDDQERVCRIFAKANGMKVVGVYADRATSGRTADRDAFQRMVSDSSEGRFGTVVVYKLDRFARDRFDAALYRHMLRDNGVTLVSAMEQIPDTPEGAILEAVIEGFNEYYSRNLSQNVMRGMVGNAEKCLANGVSVYGYDIDSDGHYVVNPRQARFVRRVFDAVAANSSTRKELVEMLNAAGERTTRGSKWSLNSLREMIRNQKYRGDYTWGSVVVEDGMPPIVSRAVWQRANDSTARYKPRTSFYTLTGRLFTENGEPYRGTSATGCTGKTYFYYSANVDGKERRVRKEDVESSVMDIVKRTLRSDGVAEAIAKLAVEAYKRQMDDGARDAVMREVEELDTAMSRILKAVEAGIVPDGTKERVEEIKARKTSLLASIEAMPELDVPSVEEVSDMVRTKLADFEPNRTLTELVGRVTIIEKDGNLMLKAELPWLPAIPGHGPSVNKNTAVSAGKCVNDGEMFGRLDRNGCELVLEGGKFALIGPLTIWSAIAA